MNRADESSGHSDTAPEEQKRAAYGISPSGERCHEWKPMGESSLFP